MMEETQNAITDTAQQPTEQLSLPGPAHQGQETKLGVSTGETVSFNHLGPIVVNSDGTMSRIHNWTEMTDTEKARTVKILSKRNLLRKERFVASAELADAAGQKPT